MHAEAVVLHWKVNEFPWNKAGEAGATRKKAPFFSNNSAPLLDSGEIVGAGRLLESLVELVRKPLGFLMGANASGAHCDSLVPHPKLRSHLVKPRLDRAIL
jgi:hypothetical protein